MVMAAPLFDGTAGPWPYLQPLHIPPPTQAVLPPRERGLPGRLPGYASLSSALPAPPAWAPWPASHTAAKPPWEGTRGEGQPFRVTYLSLQVGGFIGRGSRKDSRVTEAGAQQGPHHKEEEDATNHGDGGGDFHC